METDNTEEPPHRLDDIATDWSHVGEPALFVLRYSRAIRAYLSAMLRHADDVDEVTQQFMLRVVERGFAPARHGEGRLREYLKASLRNAVRTYFRRQAALPPVCEVDSNTPEPVTDRWRDEWKRCLLDRVWDSLADHEHRSPGNFAFTVLKLHLDYPDEDSTTLTKRLVKLTGHKLKADAFRQQLGRARRHFAAYLVREVTATLQPGTRAQIVEELADLGLLHYVQDYLPLIEDER